jgi:DNA-binding NarL/FixJ family response regulator
MSEPSARTTAPGACALRVVLGIPHVRLLHALAGWLEQSGSIRVVGRTSDCEAATRAARETSADVVILGQALVGEATGAPLQGLIGACGGIPLVIVGLDGSGAYGPAFRAAGATEYLVLDLDMDTFVEALWHAGRRGPHI